jgi:hypothetical protein
MSHFQKIDFIFELAFNKKLPSFYCEAQRITDGEVLVNYPSTEFPDLKDKIYMIYDVPSSLKVNVKPLDAYIGLKSVIQHKGYCINLEGYSDLETYLKDRFSRSSLQLLRAGKKRLETCFDITYKMYFGNIDKKHFNELFKRFYQMLELRALEKGIVNRNLNFWDLYSAKAYDMILREEASLFVIYDGNKAINISLNMHLKSTVFLFISTYDIAYSKFRLGHTNWMMQLDWFLKKGIKLIDFSKGNVDYKKRWTNTEYDFEYHLFYNSSNFLMKMKAFWIAKKLQLKQSLRNKNINIYYYKAMNLFKPKNKSVKIPKYQIMDQDSLPEKHTLEPVFFRKNDDNLFLKRIIYTRLYLSSSHVNSMKVYRELQNTHIYYLQNQKEFKKLIFEN